LLEQVEGRVDHHLHRQPGLGGAMGDAQCRLVEDGVDPVDQPGHDRAVADVEIDQADAAAGHRPRQVFRPAADHVVDNDDLGTPGRDELVDDPRPDETGPTGHQHTLVGQNTALAGHDDSILWFGIGVGQATEAVSGWQICETAQAICSTELSASSG
jgi:hypothetical protein